MKTAIVVVCTAMLFVLTPQQSALAQAPANMQAMLRAAGEATEAWLVLVDEGRYEESWENAAGLFKKAITKEQWIDMLKAVRPPLGKVQARALLNVDYKTKMPGAPDGHYVIIQYRTSFKNKSEAIETITPLLDKDGTWRVSGYFIK
jgi:hypothetical protein